MTNRSLSILLDHVIQEGMVPEVGRLASQKSGGAEIQPFIARLEPDIMS